MRKDLNINTAFIAVIIISLLFGAWVNVKRVQVEEANKEAALAIDYYMIKKFALENGWDYKKLLLDFKKAGVNSAVVRERVFEDFMLDGILSKIDWQDSYLLNRYLPRKNIRPGYSYYMVHDLKYYPEIVESLQNQVGKEKVEAVKVGKKGFVGIPLDPDSIKTRVRVGFDRAVIEEVQKMGFDFIPRFSKHIMPNEKEFDRAFQGLEPYNFSTVIFEGTRFPGYPEYLKDTAEFLKDKNNGKPPRLAYIEYPGGGGVFEPRGSQKVREELGNPVVRVLVSSFYTYRYWEFGHAWAGGGLERNDRLFYMDKFFKVAGKDDVHKTKLVKRNLQLIREARAILDDKGYKLDKAGLYHNLDFSKPVLFVISLGIIAASVFLITLLWPLMNRYRLILMGAGILLSLLLLASGFENFWRKLMALGGTITFPTLAVIWYLEMILGRGKSWLAAVLQAISGLFLITLISVVGGLLSLSMITNTKFILALDYFRGVKLLFFMPLLLVGAYYFRKYILPELRKEEGVRFINESIQKVLKNPGLYLLKYSFFGLLLIFVLIIYIGRTGHNMGIPALDIEMEFRTWLSEVFKIRPRTKEILIGHPALMLALALAWQNRRKLLLPLLVAGTIGQASLVDTFAHMNTPFLVSLIRTYNGVFIGLVLGLLLILGYYLYTRWSGFLTKED